MEAFNTKGRIMFHALIRSQQGALHIIGEVDGYSLEALRDQIASARREGSLSPVDLQIGVDEEQRDELERRTRRWVKNLLQAGATVTISNGRLA
jgi:hypothetical protein